MKPENLLLDFLYKIECTQGIWPRGYTSITDMSLLFIQILLFPYFFFFHQWNSSKELIYLKANPVCIIL